MKKIFLYFDDPFYFQLVLISSQFARPRLYLSKGKNPLVFASKSALYNQILYLLE